MLPPSSLGYFLPSEFGDPQPELAKGRVRTLPNLLNHVVKPQLLLPRPSVQKPGIYPEQRRSREKEKLKLFRYKYLFAGAK